VERVRVQPLFPLVKEREKVGGIVEDYGGKCKKEGRIRNEGEECRKRGYGKLQ